MAPRTAGSRKRKGLLFRNIWKGSGEMNKKTEAKASKRPYGGAGRSREAQGARRGGFDCCPTVFNVAAYVLRLLRLPPLAEDAELAGGCPARLLAWRAGTWAPCAAARSDFGSIGLAERKPFGSLGAGRGTYCGARMALGMMGPPAGRNPRRATGRAAGLGCGCRMAFGRMGPPAGRKPRLATTGALLGGAFAAPPQGPLGLRGGGGGGTGRLRGGDASSRCDGALRHKTAGAHVRFRQPGRE